MKSYYRNTFLRVLWSSFIHLKSRKLDIIVLCIAKKFQTQTALQGWNSP